MTDQQISCQLVSPLGVQHLKILEKICLWITGSLIGDHIIILNIGRSGCTRFSQFQVIAIEISYFINDWLSLIANWLPIGFAIGCATPQDLIKDLSVDYRIIDR